MLWHVSCHEITAPRSQKSLKHIEVPLPSLERLGRCCAAGRRLRDGRTAPPDGVVCTTRGHQVWYLASGQAPRPSSRLHRHFKILPWEGSTASSPTPKASACEHQQPGPRMRNGCRVYTRMRSTESQKKTSQGFHNGAIPVRRPVG